MLTHRDTNYRDAISIAPVLHGATEKVNLRLNLLEIVNLEKEIGKQTR